MKHSRPGSSSRRFQVLSQRESPQVVGVSKGKPTIAIAEKNRGIVANECQVHVVAGIGGFHNEGPGFPSQESSGRFMPVVNFPLEVPSSTCKEMSPYLGLPCEVGYVGQAIMVEVRGHQDRTSGSGLRGLQRAVAVAVVNGECGTADNDILLAIAIEVTRSC